MAMFLIFSCSSLSAQNYWTPNIGQFEDYMHITCYIVMNGIELEGTQYEVGSFINDDCRGSYRMQDIGYPGHPYASLLAIWGSPTENGSLLTFKVYNHDTQEIYEIDQHPEYVYAESFGITDPWRFTITTSPQYEITINNTTNGYVTSDKETAFQYETVNLTIVPDPDYELESIVAYKTGETGTTVTLTGSGNARAFVMPDFDVSIDATFSSTIPNLTITSPSNGQTVSNNDIDVSFTVINFNLGTDGRVAYKLNNGSFSYTTSSPISINGLVVGNNIITLELVDMSNNSLSPAVVKTVMVIYSPTVVSNDATLINLTVSEGELTPDFSPTTLNYTVEVENIVAEITITGTASHVGATVQGNGTKPLNVGINTFLIVVIAEDEVSTLTYTIVVTRKQATHFITATVINGNGTISPSGVIEVIHGENQLFEITSATNYIIDSVFVDNMYIGNPDTYLFENVTEDHTIEVSFKYINKIDDFDYLLTIYPNPATDFIIIESESEINNVTIFNSAGKKVYENKKVERKILSLDVHHFSTGMYYINIDGRIEKMVKM